MIEVKNLCKSYGTLPVYQNFSLSLEEGKITCLLGSSGCGKTTLLNILSGLCDYQGQVPKLTCSYVFQTPRLVPNLTVLDNLLLIEPDQAKVEEMLRAVDLWDKKDAYPKTLSGGQAQRVSFARAFLREAELILWDEPFSSLDLKLKVSLMELSANLCRRRHSTVLFVTHDVDEALSLADRVLVMGKGTIVKDVSLSGEGMRPYGQGGEDRATLISALLSV